MRYNSVFVLELRVYEVVEIFFSWGNKGWVRVGFILDGSKIILGGGNGWAKLLR